MDKGQLNDKSLRFQKAPRSPSLKYLEVTKQPSDKRESFCVEK